MKKIITSKYLFQGKKKSHEEPRQGAWKKQLASINLPLLCNLMLTDSFSQSFHFFIDYLSITQFTQLHCA